MQLTLLRVRDLRCLAEAELRPDPRLTLVVGPNGAGKSSLVEAVHVLGYGRSFRGRIRDGLVRSGAPALEVYAEWRDRDGQAHRAGLPDREPWASVDWESDPDWEFRTAAQLEPEQLHSRYRQACERSRHVVMPLRL